MEITEVEKFHNGSCKVAPLSVRSLDALEYRELALSSHRGFFYVTLCNLWLIPSFCHAESVPVILQGVDLMQCELR